MQFRKMTYMLALAGSIFFLLSVIVVFFADFAHAQSGALIRNREVRQFDDKAITAEQAYNSTTTTAAPAGFRLEIDTSGTTTSSTILSTTTIPASTTTTVGGGTTILSGSVLAFDTNRGLENVDISIPFLGRSTQSDSGGTYVLVVPSGRYIVYYNPPPALAALYLPSVQTFDCFGSGVAGDVYLMPVSTSITTTTTMPAFSSTTTSMPTSSSTTTSELCPAQKVLGDNTADIEALRAFRDGPLARSAVGRRIIEIYYNNADSINLALDRSPVLRFAARKFFEAAALLAGGEEE
jgi:hypothetical protein